MKTLHLSRRDHKAARELAAWFQERYPRKYIHYDANSPQTRESLIKETARQVIRGGKALDEAIGKEWPLLVNLRTFNISDGTSCVLGQVMGETTGHRAFYSHGEEQLRQVINVNGTVQDEAYARVFGFAVNNQHWTLHHGFSGYLDTVANPMWKHYISQRQAAYTPNYRRRFRAAVRKLAKQEV